jgi:hypothetical protein
MVPLQCSSCSALLAQDDTFCGSCGTQAPAARPPQAPAQQTRQAAAERKPPAHARPRGDFFGHPDAPPARDPDAPLTDTTRYLCAAAYLDPSFGKIVLGELLASHRAVVPSPDVDLVSVIRHCLKARRMQLARDVVLTALLVCGLVFATLPTIAVLAVAFILSRLPAIRWTRRSIGPAAGIMAAIAVLGIALTVWLAIAVLNTAGRTVPQYGPAASGTNTAIVVTILLALLAATLAVYYYGAFTTLSQRLSPDAPTGNVVVTAAHVEARIAEIDAAQHGNVTLYGGENPFIGTGGRGRSWSIAVELDRAAGAADPNRWLHPRQSDDVSVDPVELHGVLRRRLLKLKDPGLPENERIAALAVQDYVVGEGQRRWENPLIDPDRKIPYSLASEQTIRALIRHPQAGLRYYQRVSVTDEGQAVRAGGQEVISRSDQEIIVSAFVYVAVEGRMFYLEFVPTALPPIAQPYHVVDLLPKISSGQFLAKVLLHAARHSFGDLVGAPFWLLGALWRMMAEARSFDGGTEAEDYLVGDVGARISVRELGAARSVHTFIQQLDAAKYTRIIERLVTDTVLDFLMAQGVDTTAYRNSALAVVNNGVVISGGTVTGPVAAGSASTAHVSAPAPATS